MSELGASVVVPTFNRAASIERTIAALLLQDYDGGHEILVVDDGSTDRTPALLAELARRFPRIRVLHQQNAGPASARNRGAREARGQVLAFLDDDCIPGPPWLRLLVGALETKGCEIVGGLMEYQERTWVGRHLNRQRASTETGTPPESVEFLASGNVGVQAKTFRALGGFDERFTIASGEDYDFAFRARGSGLKIGFSHDAKVLHETCYTLGEYLRASFRYGRGRRLLSRLHEGSRIPSPLTRLIRLTSPVRRAPIGRYVELRRRIGTNEALRSMALRYLGNLSFLAGYLSERRRLPGAPRLATDPVASPAER